VTYDPLFVSDGKPCSETDEWTDDSSYNAVKVQTHGNIQTFFARALPGSESADQTSAGAVATATIQKVVDPNLGNAVFAMCAFAEADKKGNTDPSFVSLLTTDDTGELTLNDAAIGHRYVVWSNAGGNSNISRCGLGSSAFDGRICGLADPHCGQPISLPNWLSIDPGAQVGPTLAIMAGYPGCKPDELVSGTHPEFTPCAMVLPVCDESNSSTGQNGELHCVKFGEFLLSPGEQDDSSCTFIEGSSATICGKFLGPPVTAEGTPVTGDPGTDEPRRIALVQ
jgi:hypothetical protein